MADNKCPVCETESKAEYSCPRCGDFNWGSLYNFSRTPLERAILSHHIRKIVDNAHRKWIKNGKPKGEKKTEFCEEDFEKILKNNPSLPKAKEQLNNLIIYLGANIASPSESLKITSISLEAILGTLDKDGLDYVINHAKEQGFVDILDIKSIDVIKFPLDTQNATLPDCKLSLSFKGWELYDELKTKGSNSDKVFMAMSFSHEKEVMNTLYNGLKSAVDLTGFELHRVDENPEAGSIPDRIKVEILNSKFVIADITHHNNGAYCEAGFAEGLGKKVIYTCKKAVLDKKKTHFDVRHLTTIPWKYDKLPEFEKNIKAIIRNTFYGEAKMEDDESLSPRRMTGSGETFNTAPDPT